MRPLLKAAILTRKTTGRPLNHPGCGATPSDASAGSTCFIVGEARRADVIWSEGDFKALCEHMLNDNPPDYFLSAWIDKASAQARFSKAPQWSRADKRASWAWDTITGKGQESKRLSAFIPRIAEKESRWAAVDFDAHDRGARASAEKVVESLPVTTGTTATLPYPLRVW